MEPRPFVLPKLPYGYRDLEPYISEKQLTIHHTKHHKAYVNGCNSILQKLKRARKENTEINMKDTLKALAFNIGGHILHSIFWENLAPIDRGGGKPGGALEDAINKEFGSFDRFKREFTQTAMSVEGSGWAALAYCPLSKSIILMQIEKHNVNVYPTCGILMVLDVFEHAYYLDYENNRGKFIDAFWKIVNWNVINERLEKLR